MSRSLEEFGGWKVEAVLLPLPVIPPLLYDDFIYSQDTQEKL